MKRLYILTPVFNDWESLDLLIPKIFTALQSNDLEVKILAVNDFSPQNPPADLQIKFPALEILHLKRNLGHQRAIAVGLAYLEKNETFDFLVVMDADGEDRPEDLPAMLEKALLEKDKIVFAHRSKRSEAFFFRFFYRIYKFIFYLLTGKTISFGNFSVIPFNALHTLAHVSEIYNHFPGGIIRSKIPYTSIPIERGTRLRGQSKMNFSSLVLHGLSAISVMTDIVAVRLLILSLFLIMLCGIGIIAVLIVKYATSLAIPGWASNVLIGLTIILMQSLQMALLLIFISLSERTKKMFIPAKDFQDFV
jgi:glycosyltransferase involved in cell wall biosynthesis